MANNNRNNDIELFEKVAALKVLAEQAKEDRQAMLERMTGVEDQLRTLNGRTRKLETDNDKSHQVWGQVAAMAGPVEELRAQVAAMREPFQIVSSAIRTARVWRWRILLLIVVAFSAGNQAIRVIMDYSLTQIAKTLGVGG